MTQTATTDPDSQTEKGPDQWAKPIEALSDHQPGGQASTNNIQEQDTRPVEPREISCASILNDHQFQCREGLDESTVKEHVSVAKNAIDDGQGWPFPAITLVNGAVCDGHHRLEAAKRIGKTSILAVRHSGDREMAVRLSVGANESHGLRRSNDARRRAVEMALREWPDLSNRAIAKTCRVSHTFVANVRNPKVATLPPSTEPAAPIASIDGEKSSSQPGEGQTGDNEETVTVKDPAHETPDPRAGRIARIVETIVRETGALCRLTDKLFSDDGFGEDSRRSSFKLRVDQAHRELAMAIDEARDQLGKASRHG